jgi:very-short-patch-repair endonuclease
MRTDDIERFEAKYIKIQKIPFKHSQIIWYTGCDRYTPDLIIGEKLIVEVDGKIHDKEFLNT